MNAPAPARNIKIDATFKAVCNQRDTAMTTIAMVQGEKAELVQALTETRNELIASRKEVDDLKKRVAELEAAAGDKSAKEAKDAA